MCRAVQSDSLISAGIELFTILMTLWVASKLFSSGYRSLDLPP
jgi:hypothetical protein